MPTLPEVAPDRLRRPRDIAAVLAGRRRAPGSTAAAQRAGRLVVVHALRDTHAGPARVTTVASKRVGAAVNRNRAKRLLREAARHLAWREGCDLVLVARASTASSSFQAVLEELQALAAEADLLLPDAA